MNDMPSEKIEDPRAYWDNVYQTRRASSTGRPSAALVRVAGGLPPGRALDLGSSNGDDVIWLARQGWQALGLDIAPTAVARATARAAELGLGENARFEARDLSREGLPGETFDLVTVFFLHSPVALERPAILRAAAGRVAPGGHLLVVSHAAAPPWASEERKACADEFPTVEGELEAIGYTPEAWDRLEAGIVSRTGRAPDGTPAELEDVLILLRRKAG